MREFIDEAFDSVHMEFTRSFSEFKEHNDRLVAFTELKKIIDEAVDGVGSLGAKVSEEIKLRNINENDLRYLINVFAERCYRLRTHAEEIYRALTEEQDHFSIPVTAGCRHAGYQRGATKNEPVRLPVGSKVHGGKEQVCKACNRQVGKEWTL